VPEFTATISKIGINPVVDPPDEMLEPIFAAAGRNKGPLRVRGTINGVEFQQTLVRFRGKWRLYINGVMCRSAGVGEGDTVDIALEYDNEPRQDRIPNSLTAALDKNRQAREAFEALTPSRRREISCYIGSLKTEEAIKRNIEKVLRMLTEK
jgi:hypothetical protein